MATYRVPVLEEFSWQPPVLDKDLNAAPLSPAKGDRYIVADAVLSGDDWFGHENDVAWYDGAAWQFDTPSEGWHCWVSDENSLYHYTGSVWDKDDVSGLEASIDSLESEVSVNKSAADAGIDSLETVASAAIDSVNSIES